MLGFQLTEEEYEVLTTLSRLSLSAQGPPKLNRKG